MEVELNLRAKRSWDYSTDTENAQLKFKRLLETSQATELASAAEAQDQLKKTILQLVDGNLSFEGILRESEDCVQCTSNAHEDKLELQSCSSLTVQGCVDLLKCQASKASCPLDLLAAESLGRRLIAICHNSSEQLLSQNQLESVLCVLEVIKHMLSEQCFNRVYFTKHLTSKGPYLPLEVVWMLHKNCIVSFNTYLACCLQHSHTVEVMSGGLISLCSCMMNKDKQENILSDLLGRLVTFAFLENKAKEGSNNKLDKISQEILDNVVERSDFSACKIGKEYSSQKSNSNSLCVLEIVRRLNDIPWTAIKRFFTRQVNRFFAMPSQEGKKIS